MEIITIYYNVAIVYRRSIRMEIIEELTDRQKRRLGEFVREVIYLTEEENAAIEHQIPMTQELFEQCVGHCVEIGAYFRLTCLLNEFSYFANEYVRKIEDEVADSDIEIPESTPEELEASWQRFRAKVKERYGEDVI